MHRFTNFLVGAAGIMVLSVLASGQPSGRAFGDDAPPKQAEPKKAEPKKAEAKKAIAPKDRAKAAPAKVNASVFVVEVEGKPVAAKKGAVMRNDAGIRLGDLWNAAVQVIVGDNAVAVPRAAALRMRADQQKAQNEAMQKQFEQAYGPQFKKLYRSELQFMRLVCKPTRQQYEKIVADSGPEKEHITALAMLMVDQQHGRMNQGEAIDPRKMVAVRLVKGLRPTLSAEQAASYQKELDLRDAAKKRVVLRGLVAKFDKVLTLTPEQRTQLSEILEKNWHASWNNTQYLMYGGRYFPAMPDAKINPILTETQKAVWSGMQKGNVHFGFDFGLGQGLEMEEEAWSEPGKDDKEAAKPEVKK